MKCIDGPSKIGYVPSDIVFGFALAPRLTLTQASDEGLNPTTREPVAEVANDVSRAASSVRSVIKAHDL